MRRFAELYDALDQSNSTTAKVQAMVRYFDGAPSEDAAWAVCFLSGERLRSAIGSRLLNEWAAEYARVDAWVFDACYEAVGDKAETIALLIDALPDRQILNPWEPPLHEAVAWVEARRGESPEDQKAALFSVWQRLDGLPLFVFNKLLTGALRVGVAKRLVVRALAEWSGIESHAIFHRLMGTWRPSGRNFEQLFTADVSDADVARPFPFFLASPLAEAPATLGAEAAWLAEWKWDGIRAQLVRRRSSVWLWSRGEELISEQFPEVVEAAAALREVPCVLMAYDLLEVAGEDWRPRPLRERRARLEQLLAHDKRFALSPLVPFDRWAVLSTVRSQSRERGVEGLMLKSAEAPYGVGRVRGPWWKWKIEPLEIDAVLLYAQPGHGRRAGLHTDYTFALWDDAGELVPVAKAYSGLDNGEIRELDKWIRSHTIEKFGPVRAVEAQHVFELHFENVAHSKRHKSGIAVRFPRIARWRRELTPQDADKLTDLQKLIV